MEFAGFRRITSEGGGFYGEASRKNAQGFVTHPLGSGVLQASLNLLDLSAQNPGSLDRSGLAEGGRAAHPFYVRQQTGKDITQAQVGVTWSGAVGGTGSEVTAWGLLRDVWNPIPPAIIDLDRTAGGLRGALQGRRFLGRADLTWLAGLEWALQDDGRRNFLNEEGRTGPLTLNQREVVVGAGAFLQALLDFQDRGTLLGTLRYHRNSFRVNDAMVGPEDPDDSGRRTMGALSPSLGASIVIRDRMTLRASLSSFFQTPTTTELANRPSGAGGFNPQLEPEKGWSLDGGFFLDLPVGGHLELSAFETRIRDELVPFQVPEAEGRVFFRNAGRSRYRGVELGATVAFGPGLSFRGTASVLDARFLDFAPDGQDLEGNRIPGAPRHSVDAVLTWEGSIPSGNLDGFVELRTLYRGSVAVDDVNSDAAGPFLLLDLRMGVGSVQLGEVALSPFVGIGNLLDRAYVTSVSVNAFGGRFFDPGPPRSFHFGVQAVLAPFASSPREAPEKEDPHETL
jgi:iron complex outermembrane receptor protein